jgi:hypothetical protein
MKNWMIGLGVTTVSALAVTACSSSSGSTASPMDSGTPDATTELDTGLVSDDTGTPDTGTTPVVEAGTGEGGADAGSLYDRLGGHAGIRGAVNAIVTKELMDTNIKSYFFNQVATPVPAGHPTAAQIEECFTDLLATNAGGPEVYPAMVTPDDDAGNSVTVAADAGDAGGFACRADMTTIHAPLMISGGTFDSFVMIAGGVLTSAMGTGSYTYTTADINTIAGLLTGTKTSIVTASLADAGAQPYPVAVDAGDAGPDGQ